MHLVLTQTKPVGTKGLWKKQPPCLGHVESETGVMDKSKILIWRLGKVSVLKLKFGERTYKRSSIML